MKALMTAMLVAANLPFASPAQAEPMSGAGRAAAIGELVYGSGFASPIVSLFLGGSVEGTGIRRAAPGVGVIIHGFLGGSQEGTGIRRAAPGVVVHHFAGGTTEGTGI